GRAAGDERGERLRLVDAAQRRVVEVHRAVGPAVDPERGRALVGAEREQRVERDDAAAPCRAPRDPVELAELLERVDADVRVGAGADADPAFAEPPDRREAVPEARLRRRAETDARAGLGEQVELRVRRMRGVDDGRARPEATRPGEQLDRREPVLRAALLDLPRLLVRVDVEDEALARGVRAE